MIKQSFTLIAVLLIYCSTAFGQNVSIKGNILNSADPVVKVNIPVDGKSFSGANIETQLDQAKGTFEFDFPITKSGFVIVSNNWRSITLFVVPGKSYQVQWDMKSKAGISILGHEIEGQMMLQEIVNNRKSKEAAALLDSLQTVKERLSLANQLAKDKIKTAKSYYKQKKISKEFYQATLKLIEVDRINMLSTNFFFEYRKWERRSEEDMPKMTVFFKEFMPAWGKLYATINRSNGWLTSKSYTNLLGRYTAYLNLVDSGRLIFGGGNYAMTQIHQVEKTFKGEMLEYAWANLIVAGVDQKEFEKEWIYNFEDFKAKFPKSSLIPYLETTIQKVVDYQAKLESQQNPEVKFVKDYVQINELPQLLAALKGKVTYVDLWATWCVPCREELQYSIAMHQSLEDLGVQVVYISIDRDSAHDAWYKMVYGLGLKGLNMRVNPTFHKELSAKVPNFVGIPRYLIINKDGEVVNWNAKRPSDQLDLINQLKEYL